MSMVISAEDTFINFINESFNRRCSTASVAKSLGINVDIARFIYSLSVSDQSSFSVQRPQ